MSERAPHTIDLKPRQADYLRRMVEKHGLTDEGKAINRERDQSSSKGIGG